MLNIIPEMAKSTRKILSLPYTASPSKIISRLKNVMGIIVLYTNSTKFDGCLKWNNSTKKPEIIISKKDGYYRTKFTIAHELGHLILHWKWKPGNDLTSKVMHDSTNNVLDMYHPMMFRNLLSALIGGGPLKFKEIQANEFAADLLMPAQEMRKIYDQSFSKNLDYVKYKVSKILDVSTDAAYHRLKNLKKRKEL